MTLDILTFYSHFHPLLVHLPIGFLCFALILELFYRWRKDELVLKTVPMLWLATAISAILAASSGYLLGQEGDYDEQLLGWHRTGGIVIAVLSTLICLLYFLPSFQFSKLVRSSAVFISFILLILTGHWGGSLTHGAGYLTETSTRTDILPTAARISSLDSVDIFKDAVMPVFQAKCVSCHNPKKKKGDLLLTGYEEIIKGGKTRAGVIPGNTSTSEVFRRITLPKDHKEFMPSGGKKPLTETQTAIIEWWIETGAHKEIAISKLNPDKKMTDVFNDFFQLDRDAILSYQAPPASKDDIAALLKAGFQVNSLGTSNNLLEVKFNGQGQNKPDLSLLPNLSKQLVWLQLTNCGLVDEDLKTIIKLENLFKLNLNRNKITDTGAAMLSSLSKLEYLNLYGTNISGAGLAVLTELPALKKLYAWDTRVDSTAVASLSIKNKKLELVYRLEP